MSFRLTFNLPAQTQFFDMDGVLGTRIKIHNGKMILRPVTDVKNDDAVAFSDRPRGGLEVNIDGSMSDELLAFLSQEATPTQPFFLLSHSWNVGEFSGWIRVKEHWNSDEAPAKTAPHMRVWFPKPKIKSPSVVPLDDEITEMFGEFSLMIRTAKSMVDDWTENRNVGRPSKDIQEAREVLKQFKTFCEEIIPRPDNNIDIDNVKIAVNVLSQFVAIKEGRDIQINA